MSCHVSDSFTVPIFSKLLLLSSAWRLSLRLLDADKNITGAINKRVVLPHTQELRLLSRSRCFGFHLQTVDVSDGDNGGGHVPRQAHEGANDQEDSHPEQIQMVTCPFLVQTPKTRSKGHACAYSDTKLKQLLIKSLLKLSVSF